MNMVKKRIASWAEYEVEELPHFDIKGELQCGLLQLFVSHLFFGESLDISFVMNHVYPGPQLTFWYPYFPNWLNPAYHKLKRSKESLYDFMRECPRAGENRAAYEAAGLTEIEAFEAMLTMLTFNASGAGNSGLNLLYYLPHFEGKEQMKDDDELLTSFCYEVRVCEERSDELGMCHRCSATNANSSLRSSQLLRNNGPPTMFKMGFTDGSKNNDDYTTVHTSKKEAFAIKNGTTCYFNCAVLGRDETRWEDPDTFRADRFVPLAPATQVQRDSTTGTEPLPVLALGCPLGKSKDEEYVKNAHCCVFMDLIVPFLKAVTRTMLDHEYKLDHHSNAVLGKLVKGEVTQLSGGSRRSKCPFAFNISPENMNQAADITEDQTPPVGPKVRVQYFHRAATG